MALSLLQAFRKHVLKHHPDKGGNTVDFQASGLIQCHEGDKGFFVVIRSNLQQMFSDFQFMDRTIMEHRHCTVLFNLFLAISFRCAPRQSMQPIVI